jgi:hypothetical protein
MGKLLIIKDANFSANSIEKIVIPEPSVYSPLDTNLLEVLGSMKSIQEFAVGTQAATWHKVPYESGKRIYGVRFFFCFENSNGSISLQFSYGSQTANTTMNYGDEDIVPIGEINISKNAAVGHITTGKKMFYYKDVMLPNIVTGTSNTYFIFRTITTNNAAIPFSTNSAYATTYPDLKFHNQNWIFLVNLLTL